MKSPQMSEEEVGPPATGATNVGAGTRTGVLREQQRALSCLSSPIGWLRSLSPATPELPTFLSCTSFLFRKQTCSCSSSLEPYHRRLLPAFPTTLIQTAVVPITPNTRNCFSRPSLLPPSSEFLLPYTWIAFQRDFSIS